MENNKKKQQTINKTGLRFKNLAELLGVSIDTVKSYSSFRIALPVRYQMKLNMLNNFIDMLKNIDDMGIDDIENSMDSINRTINIYKYHHSKSK